MIDFLKKLSGNSRSFHEYLIAVFLQIWQVWVTSRLETRRDILVQHVENNNCKNSLTLTRLRLNSVWAGSKLYTMYMFVIFSNFYQWERRVYQFFFWRNERALQESGDVERQNVRLGLHQQQSNEFLSSWSFCTAFINNNNHIVVNAFKKNSVNLACDNTPQPRSMKKLFLFDCYEM